MDGSEVAILTPMDERVFEAHKHTRYENIAKIADELQTDSKGNLERFLSTSLRTHGLAISFQPCFAAISRMALDAPDLERQAARRTLVSRKILMLPQENFCIPLRHQQPIC